MSWSMRQIKQSADGLAYMIEEHAKNAEHWDPVAEKIGAMVGHMSASGWGGMFVYLTGTVKDLAAVWREMRQLGYKTDYAELQQEPTTEQAIKFTKTIEGIVVATVTVNFSSSICKRVQVGTKTEEVPVFEVRCGEPEPEGNLGQDIPF